MGNPENAPRRAAKLTTGAPFACLLVPPPCCVCWCQCWCWCFRLLAVPTTAAVRAYPPTAGFGEQTKVDRLKTDQDSTPGCWCDGVMPSCVQSVSLSLWSLGVFCGAPSANRERANVPKINLCTTARSVCVSDPISVGLYSSRHFATRHTYTRSAICYPPARRIHNRMGE